MNITAFLCRLMIVAIIMPAWSLPAFCGQIHYASAAGNREIVKKILEYYPDRISSRDDEGKTPLHVAVEWNQKDVAELLLAKGADVNAKGKDDWTPLDAAVGHARKDIVKLLLAKGADINAKDKGGETPLHFAAEFGRKDMVALLLSKGAEIDARNAWGWTALHWAARNGSMDIAKLLLAKRADVNISENFNNSGNSGRTPLGIAEESGHKDVVKLLRQHGGHY
jgi:ankyrin repeat protein